MAHEFPLLAGLPIPLFPATGTTLRISRPDQILAVQRALAGCGRVAAVSFPVAMETSFAIPGVLARICACREVSSEVAVVVLSGTRRILVTDSVVRSPGVHLARIEFVNESLPAIPVVDPETLRRQIVEAVRGVIPETRRQEYELLINDEKLSLGGLADVVADSLPLSNHERWEHLRDPSLESRCDRLLNLITEFRQCLERQALRGHLALSPN